MSICAQVSLCNEPLRELANAGASGSIFYVTQDDEFIVKTVQHKEGELLLKLLPAYFMVSRTRSDGGQLWSIRVRHLRAMILCSGRH